MRVLLFNRQKGLKTNQASLLPALTLRVSFIVPDQVLVKQFWLLYPTPHYSQA